MMAAIKREGVTSKAGFATRTSGALHGRNFIAGGDRGIKRGDGRGDIKRDVMLVGENGHGIRANFVGGVAVRGDAVRANDDRADSATAQEMADHVVRDERERNSVLVQFPGGEAGALEIGTRLGNKNFERAAGFDGDADDAQGRADAAGGESAGVALSHDAATFRHELGAEFADGFVGGFAFAVNSKGLFDEFSADFFHRTGGGRFRAVRERIKFFAKAVDGPEKIDGSGASAGKRLANFLKFRAQFLERLRARMHDAEGDAHRGGHADGRSAADDHVLDGLREFAVIGIGVVDDLGGKAALIEEDNALVCPPDWLDAAQDVLSWLTNRLNFIVPESIRGTISECGTK